MNFGNPPFAYQRPDSHSVELIRAVQNACAQLYGLICTQIPDCRERSITITKLEEVSMWAANAVMMTQPPPDGTPWSA